MIEHPVVMLHMGFRLLARRSWHHESEGDDFEVLSAARDGARLLEAGGWVDIRLYEVQVTDHEARVETLIDMEWRA